MKPELESEPQDDPNFEIELELLLHAVYLKYHYDFRGYSRSSLRRRLERARQTTGCETLSQLQERVLREPTLFTRLLDTLTVQVSTLFRDPAYFLALRQRVLPYLRSYPSLKLWVAGCSTGEEAYSLAILLREEGLLERSQIYATDINPSALAVAESGVYALERLSEFQENHLQSGATSPLSRHCTIAYGRAVFDRELRSAIVFSDHSLATDSVFAEMQFVSCRNVLIYFQRPLQDRAVGLFHEALCRRGFLGLGTRESLRFTQYAADYEEFVREERIYRKLDTSPLRAP